MKTVVRLLPGLPSWAALWLVAAGASSSRAADPAQLVGQAVKEYQAALDCPTREARVQRFRSSELLFAQALDWQRRSLAARQAASPELLVNLGNSALGGERLGPAILAYRRALALRPGHRRAEQNLRHARSLLPDWVPRPDDSGLFYTFLGWLTRLTTSQQRGLSAWLFSIAAGLLAGAIRWQRPALRNLAIVASAAWLGLLLMSLAERGTSQEAVIIVEEVMGHAAESAYAPKRFTQPLPGGTEVAILESHQDWSHIRLADGRDAWIPASAAEIVLPSQ